jgi:FkbM family methyltransferase
MTDEKDMKSVETTIRGVTLKLVAYSRALELCARMNRELEVLDFIDAIPSGGVLYDCGACEGRFSLYAGLKGITCISFEPEAKNFQAFTDNIALNGGAEHSHIRAFKYAIGERSGTASLQIAQPWPGGHQKVLSGSPGRSDLNFNFTDQEVVGVVSLDTFITEKNLPLPTHMKIDVDGSEMLLLKGAGATLSSPVCRDLMFELNPSDILFADIVSIVECYGFREIKRFEVEPGLFNIHYKKITG